jgi:hypothetical protein
MQKFEIKADWSIAYTTHKTSIAYADITTKLGFNTDPTAPWLSALSDLYGAPTNNFDGYIKRVVPNDDYTLTFQCYTLDSAGLEGFKVAHLETWKKEQIKAIEAALKRHAKGFTSTIDGEIRGNFYLGNMKIREVDDF